MQHDLYPPDWKQRAKACLERANYRCEHCRIPHGTLRVGKYHRNLYFVHLHAAHINHDPDNPQAELQALCPSCHLKHDRQSERGHVWAIRRQGYQVVSVVRFIAEARSAGLHITQQGRRYAWQIGHLSGLARDPLDALGHALHGLMMEVRS